MTDHHAQILAIFEHIAAERDDEIGDRAAAELFDIGLQRDELVLEALATATRNLADLATALTGSSPFVDLLLEEAHRCDVHRRMVTELRA